MSEYRIKKVLEAIERLRMETVALAENGAKSTVESRKSASRCFVAWEKDGSGTENSYRTVRGFRKTAVPGRNRLAKTLPVKKIAGIRSD